MAISNEKLLQRIVKKYNLVKEPNTWHTWYISYAPKPASCLRFSGGLLKYDDGSFFTCELEPNLERCNKMMIAMSYVEVSRNELEDRVKKIIEYYQNCDLLYKKELLDKKIKRINNDF